ALHGAARRHGGRLGRPGPAARRPAHPELPHADGGRRGAPRARRARARVRAGAAMRATAILPVKSFPRAKTRLADAIGKPQRAALLKAMLSDVLAALDRAREVERVIVVTAEGRAERVAMEQAKRLTTPIEVIREGEDQGHSEAAVLA